MRVNPTNKHKDWLKRMSMPIHMISDFVTSLALAFTLHFGRKPCRKPKDCFCQPMPKREPLQRPVLSNCNQLLGDTRKSWKHTCH